MVVPQEMRALTLQGAGYDNLKVETVPVPVPNADQMLARVDCAGVCTSLLKIIFQGADHPMMYNWDLQRNPAILGDEGSITIMQVGKNLKSAYKAGERFVMQPASNHPPIYRRDQYPESGKLIAKTGVGYTLPGHLAEYVLVTEDVIVSKSLIKIPDISIPYAHAAIAEPLSCCISAQEHHFHIDSSGLITRRKLNCGVKPGGVLVVVGAGMMGKMNLDIALEAKPRVAIITDFIQERLIKVETLFRERASRQGSLLITANPAQLNEILYRVSDGAGADDVIVAVGKKEAVEQSQELVARGGVLNIFGGLPKSDERFSMRSGRIHYDEITVVGSSGGIPWDIARTLDLIAKRGISPELHINRVCDLSDLPEILKLMRENKVEGKVVTYPNVRLTSQIIKSGWTKEDEHEFLRSNNSLAYSN